MRKILATMILSAAILSLGMLGSSAVFAEEYEDTVYIGAEISSLDSADPYGTTGMESQVFTNMTHMLLTYNNTDTGELEGITAESWKDLNGDGVDWQITLKKGVHFHTGEEMTAEDVQFTWEYCHPDAGNVVKPISAAAYVDSYEIVDDYNIIFHLKSGMYDFPTYLDTKIYSKKAFDTMEPEAAALVGNGPYMWDESLQQVGVQYGATRFDDYFEGTDNYPTKHLVFKCIPDGDAIVASLQAGEIDALLCLQSAPYYITLESDPNINVLSRDGAQSFYMGWNWTSELVKDVKFRTAIAKAINKDDIIAVAFENGVGASPSYNFCPPTGLGYAEVNAIQYDPEGAKALLEEIGVAEGTKLTLIHYASMKKVAEVIQANLAEIGIDCAITQMDASNWTAIKSSKEGYDIFLDYCSYKGALLYNYNRFFQENGSSNMVGYYSEEFEQLLNNVLSASSYEGMLEEFATMQQFVADDVSVIPLAYGRIMGAALKDVEGYSLADTTNWMNHSKLCIPKRG